jgi:hypothetical protein
MRAPDDLFMKANDVADREADTFFLKFICSYEIRFDYFRNAYILIVVFFDGFIRGRVWRRTKLLKNVRRRRLAGRIIECEDQDSLFPGSSNCGSLHGTGIIFNRCRCRIVPGKLCFHASFSSRANNFAPCSTCEYITYKREVYTRERSDYKKEF